MKKTIALVFVLAILLTSCRLADKLRNPATPPPSAAVPPAAISATPVSVSTPFDSSRLGTTERDVTYCTVDGVALKMDIYYPASADGLWPVVLYVHGGAWVRGSKSEGAGMGDQFALTAAGFLYVAIDYRLAPEYKFPAMIEDAKCAVRYLRAHSMEYNLDPERIGALGGSAGGHLVSLLGLSDPSAGWDVGQYLDQSSRVQAVVDYFGPSDLTVSSFDTEENGNNAVEVFGTDDPNDPALAAASPVTYITSDDPPFLILHGNKDTAVPIAQSQILYDQLTAAGVPATFVIVRNAGHGFAPTGGTISPTRQEISQMVVNFFNQHLK